MIAYSQETVDGKKFTEARLAWALFLDLNDDISGLQQN